MAFGIPPFFCLFNRFFPILFIIYGCIDETIFVTQLLWHQASGKLLILDQLLLKLHDSGHRVLLFAQMTHTLDILQVSLFLFFIYCEVLYALLLT